MSKIQSDRSQISRNLRNWRYLLLAIIFSFVVVACDRTSTSDRDSVQAASTENKVLKIWWDKGFTWEEDDALQQIVSNWEKQSGKKVQISFYSTDELSQKTERELRSGDLPDLIATFKSEKSLAPRLAWEGKLADVSDVIKPVESLYSKNVLKTVNFYNKAEQKRLLQTSLP